MTNRKSSQVDVELIQPFLRDYLVRHEISTLAIRSGVNEHTIGKILYKKQTKVAFDTADRLVCAIGLGGQFWNSKEMKDIYKKINLRYIDKQHPIHHQLKGSATTVRIESLLPAT